MKRFTLAVLLVTTLFLGLARPVLGDGLIIPMPHLHEPAPPLRSLAIKYHRVTVTIDNQVATTHVDQVFLNESPYEMEGEYIFPLPEGASISQFAMWVDGQRLEAEILDRDKARQIYEDIVRQQRDPALLEYAGRNAFRARIYPIPAHGEKRIELEYSEILAQDQGLVRYVYPLSTERFSTRPLEEASITVRITSRQPLKAVYSPSHEVAVRKQGEESAEASYRELNVTPDKDFVLYYTVSESDIGVNLVSYKAGKEDGFFLLLLAPRTTVEEEDLVAKDVLLIVDTSGSMRGDKLAQTKGAARYVLSHLNARDRFNIISFSSGTSVLAPGLRPASDVSEALAFVEGLRASGGTDIRRAFEVALAQATDERPQIVIFLTDGQPTVGEVNSEKIIADVGQRAGEQVRIFCFGVGNDVNTVLLDTVSQAHHGTSAYVRPDEDIEQVVSSFYEKISKPVLADVSLDFGAVQVEDAYPYPLPDLFAGGQIVLVGRYRLPGSAAANTTITLRGTLNGRPGSYTFRDVRFRSSDAAPSGEEFIPRLWATRKIGHLLTQIRLHGQNRELVDEVVELSVRYGIVTPYTSFLVDETEDALTNDGRRELARKAAAPAAEGKGGLGGGDRTATAPAASGAQAVEKSVAQESLRQADVAAAPQSEQVRTVGDRTFVLRDRLWTDTTYDAAQMPVERVAFGSARYFQLVGSRPEWGRYLALGPEVILVWEGRAYHVGAQGETTPQVEPAQGTPTPAPRSRGWSDSDLWRYLSGLWKGWVR